MAPEPAAPASDAGIAGGGTAGAERRPVVLVVQAEALLAMELDDLLAGAGYRVLSASDAEAAVAMAGGATIAAAIVDLQLQAGDGRKLVRTLRRRLPGVPVVVTSGTGPLEPAADLRGLGGPTARVTKPYDAERLLRRLRDALTSATGVAC